MFVFSWHFLTFLNGSDIIGLFLISGNSPTGIESLEAWRKMNPKQRNRAKHLMGEPFLNCAKMRLLSMQLSPYVSPVQVRQRRRQEGRKEEREATRCVNFTFEWNNLCRVDFNQTWRVCLSCQYA